MTVSLANHQHIHFVGIGGIGMSALARVLLARGYTVSGSDQVAGAQTAALTALGATVSIGHHANAVAGADLVVTTPAAGKAPDVQSARGAGIPIIRRAELLGALTNPHYGIAVAGTHGKSTTSSLISHMCVEAHLDPTVIVGAVAANLGSNARVGKSDLVVVEADEFDAAFLELTPEIGVITSAEPEHLDYFGTADRMFESFNQFARQVRQTLVVCSDDVPLDRVTTGVTCNVVTYGLESGQWQAEAIEERQKLTSFRAGMRHERANYSMLLAGEHNVRNALAALATALELGIQPEIATAALATFAGIRRRFEVVGEATGVLIMDDYGHHPTEIRKTLGAMQRRYNRPIVVLFQPHTYSRTKSFLNDFANAFEDAERVYVLDIYGARESDTLGLAAEDVARVIAERHPKVVYTGTHTATLDAVVADLRPGELVVTMGAGDVELLGPALLDALLPATARGAHAS